MTRAQTKNLNASTNQASDHASGTPWWAIAIMAILAIAGAALFIALATLFKSPPTSYGWAALRVVGTVAGNFLVAWFVLSKANFRQEKQFAHERAKDEKAALQQRYAEWGAASRRFIDHAGVTRRRQAVRKANKTTDQKVSDVGDEDRKAVDAFESEFELLLIYESDPRMLVYIQSASNWILRAHYQTDERYDLMNITEANVSKPLCPILELIESDTRESNARLFDEDTSKNIDSLTTDTAGVASAARAAVIREKRRRWQAGNR